MVNEPESRALFDLLRDETELVSSQLARVEVSRALARAEAGESAAKRAAEVFSTVGLLRMDQRVLAQAEAVEPRELRTLDAIHLATVLSIDGVRALVTYDRRLAEAVSQAGLTVLAPA